MKKIDKQMVNGCIDGKQKRSWLNTWIGTWNRVINDIDIQLLNACIEGNLQKAKDALDNGADVNTRDNDYSDTPLIKSSWNGYYDMVKLLLDRGADVNKKDDYGYTALIRASQDGHAEVVKLLLDRGANAEAVNNKGRTAVSYVFDIKDKDKRQEMLELFNSYHPELFMSEYMDRSVGGR